MLTLIHVSHQRLTYVCFIKVQAVDGGEEDAYLNAGAGAPPSAPMAVVARELSQGGVVVEFLKSGSPDLSFVTPILDAAFEGVKEGYDILKTFSTVRVLQFGKELETLITGLWAPTTGTKTSSAIIDDGFLVDAEADKLGDELRTSLNECIMRRSTITDIHHPMLTDVTWMTPLLVELVSV